MWVPGFHWYSGKGGSMRSSVDWRQRLWPRATLERGVHVFVISATFVLSAVSSAHAADGTRTYVRDVEFALEELEKNCGHFFPVKGIDWKKVSRQFRREVRSVKNSQQHLVLLVRLLARLEDGHASVRPLEKGKGIRWPDDGWSRHTGPGMFWCRIGKKIFIKNTWATAKAMGLSPGLEVVAVNGLPAAKWIDRRIETLSDRIGFSTDQQAFFYACHWGLADAPGTRLKLTLRKGRGRKKSGVLTYEKASAVPWGPAFFPEGLETSKDLRWGTTEKSWGYIHVRRCPGNLPELMDRPLRDLDDAPGIILDFRGNSGGGFDHDALLGRFVPRGKTISFAKRYRSAGPRPYGGPVVVIVDATIRSAGETAAGIFKEDGRAYMIGESPTAGMSSSKTRIALPSGLFELYVSVHSNKARFNKGRGIEGVGVIPHEIVEFRPKDLEVETDTLIERAEALLAKFPQKKVPYDPTAFGWKKKRGER